MSRPLRERIHLPRVYGLLRQFVALEFAPVDLRRLRDITRRVHAKDYPHLPVLSDHQCDVVIETVYPSTRAAEAIRVIQEAVDRGEFQGNDLSRKPVYTGPVDAFSERARHYEDLDRDG